jgi:signal transduction histidine kinase
VKIKQKIILVVLPVVIVSILAISIIALKNFYTSTNNEIIQKLELTGDNIMDKVSRLLFERVGDIKFLSGSGVLSNPNVTLDEKVDFLRTAERAYKTYASMSLYNTEGIKIGDTRSLSLGLNETQKPFFKHAIGGEIYYDRVPVLSQSLSQYVIHFSAPLYDTSGNISGVVVARYPITKLNDIFRNFPDPGSQNSVPLRLDLVADNGLVIYSNYDRKSILNDNLGDLNIFKILTNNSLGSTTTIPVTVESTGPYGESLYAGIAQGHGYLDYSGSGWYLILSESTREVYADFQNTIYQFILTAGIILTIAVVLVLLFSDRLITPISRLRDAALVLSKGNYDTPIPSRSKDEIGDLSNALEIMRSRITETNKHLNDLVDEKTYQLSEMNRSLVESKKNLEEVNKSLIQSDRAKEEFIMMVSHELKTPITPAKMYVEVLLKSKSLGELSEKQRRAIGAVYQSILKLEDLINDVLDVYKLDVGKLSIKKKSVLVEDIVNENFSELKPLMKNKGIRFAGRVSPSCEDVSVLCDPKRISQVVCNLVTNSVDFVPDKGGNITLSADLNGKVTGEDPSVLFSVRDNGPGIPKDKIPDLFKKFYQIDTSLTRKHGGTGLGLAISKGIVEAHGGKIWIDLDYTNGTCVKFTVPIEKQEAREGIST